MNERFKAGKTNGLTVAAKHYYWKPSQALFHMFELEEYFKTKVSVNSSVASLGCHGGVFEIMLKEMNILDHVDMYLDIDPEGLNEIVKRNDKAVQSDVRKLPFKNNSFSFIIANELISSIPTDSEKDIDITLGEVSRSLKDDGLFLFTVPTPYFEKNLFFPKLFLIFGLENMARRYRQNFNKRAAHYIIIEKESWSEKLSSNHFVLENTYSYFTPREAFWYSILSISILRIYGVTKLLNNRIMKEKLASIFTMLFKHLFIEEQSLSENDKRESAGFLLLVARKIKN
jgi:SAM-dependent methyltransferase